MKKINEEEIRWKAEANSGYNDGWTRKHYQDKIDNLNQPTFESKLEEMKKYPHQDNHMD